MNLSGKKSIITYTSDTAPDSGVKGETWLNPATNEVSYWNGGTWIKIKGITSAGLGWTVGGTGDIDGAGYSFMQRINFALDAGSITQSPNMSVSTNSPHASNSSTKGFIAAGMNPVNVFSSTIYAFSFDNDSAIASTTRFISNTGAMGGASFNSSSYGYWAGGRTNTSQTSRNVIDKIFFNNSSNSVNIGTLTQSKMTGGGFNSSQHGYITGGDGSTNSAIERFAFASEGNSAQVGNLAGSNSLSIDCNSSLHGFMCGGYYDGAKTSIERLAFPFNSGSSTVINSLNSATYLSAGLNSQIYGYIAGGPVTSNLMRFAFPLDSASSAIIATMPVGIYSYGSKGIDQTDFVSQFI